MHYKKTLVKEENHKRNHKILKTAQMKTHVKFVGPAKAVLSEIYSSKNYLWENNTDENNQTRDRQFQKFWKRVTEQIETTKGERWV